MKKFQLIVIVGLLVGGQVWAGENLLENLEGLINTLKTHDALHAEDGKKRSLEEGPIFEQAWKIYQQEHLYQVINPLQDLVQEVRDAMQKAEKSGTKLSKQQLALFHRQFKRLVKQEKKIVAQRNEKIFPIYDRWNQFDDTDEELEPNIGKLYKEAALAFNEIVRYAPGEGKEVKALEQEAEMEDVESLAALFEERASKRHEAEAKQKHEGKSKAQIEAGWRAD